MGRFLLIMASLFISFSVAANDSNVVLNEHNTIVMNSKFDSTSTSLVAQKAYQLNTKLPKGEAINLVLDSGGGSIQAGLELITNLNSLGRPVNTICVFCASMAFQTIQGLNGKRIILPFGTMMSHKARGGFRGEFPGQLTNRLNYYLRRLAAMDKITVARTSGKHTLESYRTLYENEYWCDGQDCVDQGFSDSVQSVACDSSLSGKDEKVYNVPVRLKRGQISTVQFTLVKAKCPTITGILEVKFTVEGITYNFPSLEMVPRNFRDAIELAVKKHREPTMEL